MCFVVFSDGSLHHMMNNLVSAYITVNTDSTITYSELTTEDATVLVI